MNQKNHGLLRLAQPKDLDQITAIYNWAVINTVSTFDLKERTHSEAEKWYTLHQEKRYPLFVIENSTLEGKILGWGSISPFHSRPAYNPTGEFSIYISPEEFGKGYGSLLLDKLCETAKEQKFHSLMGLISSENEGSLKLSFKYGFENVGHYKEVGYKFERWLDIIVVQKVFSSTFDIT